MRWKSLSFRLSMGYAAMVLVVTIIVATFSYGRAGNALERMLASRGRMILSLMETAATDRLVVYNYAFLRTYVTDMKAKESVVSYAAVANDQGTFIAHSEPALEGKKWDEGVAAPGAAAPGPAAPEPRERQTVYKGKRVMEMASPVVYAGKRWGTFVVGINRDEVDASLHSIALSVALVGGVVLALAIGIARFFTGSLTADLERLLKSARDIASGELRSHVPEEGLDEIRSLAEAFNAMAEHLRSIIRQIQETGAVVGEFSANVSKAIQDQAAGAAAEAASVAEVTATAEELTRTSHKIADNAESVKNTASQTMEMAEQGNVLLREAVGSMEQIRDRVGDIAQKIQFLRDKSNEIGKVMEIIKEIASEIHLLALNAAIESAAAGEHGRRFSVVASEVRRLADKTRESTETIRAIISEIQSATNSSVRAAEDGTREVDKGRETVKLSSSAFDEIIQMIEKTSESSTQISLATHQQTSANEQVVHVMRQVAEAVRQSAGQMKESAASVGELKELASRLREKVSLFRV